MASTIATGIAKGLGMALELDYKERQEERRRKFEEGMMDRRLEDGLFAAKAQAVQEQTLKNEVMAQEFLRDPTGTAVKIFTEEAQKQGLTGLDLNKAVNSSMKSWNREAAIRMASRFTRQAIDVKGRSIASPQSILDPGSVGEVTPFQELSTEAPSKPEIVKGERGGIFVADPVKGTLSTLRKPDAPEQSSVDRKVALITEFTNIVNDPMASEADKRNAYNQLQALGATARPTTFEVQDSTLEQINLQLQQPGLSAQEQQRLLDRKALILGNMSDATDTMRTGPVKFKAEVAQTEGILKIGLVNTNNLMRIANPELGGPRRWVTMAKDTLQTYYAGIVGSDRSAQDIFLEMDNAIASTTDASSREYLEKKRQEMSSAYKQGTATFLSETIKFDIANAIKHGQRLTADDLIRVDRMVSGPIGSEAFAAGLATAREQIVMRRELAMKQAFQAHGLDWGQRYVAIDPDTGINHYYYTDAASGGRRRFEP